MMETGKEYVLTETVSPERSALQMQSGDLPVLATPAMIALMECAAMRLAAMELTSEQTTVGIAINVKHIRATAVGDTLTVKAQLLLIEGRKLVFSVQAFDSKGLIGEGEHERFIVFRERFLSKL